VNTAASKVAHLIEDAGMLEKREWDVVIDRYRELVVEGDMKKLLRHAETHHNLRTYQPIWWLRGETPGPNRTLHNNKLDASAAKSIHRLIVGGQGLLGGDPAVEGEPTRDTCCLYCLRQGQKQVESLWHVAFTCEAYSRCRRQISEIIGDHPRKIFILSRSQWQWSQLRVILRFLQDLINERASTLGTRARLDCNVSDEIERLWAELEAE
jgi:hypothetical protein